eukprot:Hpha_TRINITY_DN4048_c0_g1::TRINITY_DN4048_c0_g1_i1::g.63691::m.63691
MGLSSLPEEMLREVLGWLPPEAGTVELRCVGRRWNTYLKERIVMVCCHRYVEGSLKVFVPCGYPHEPISALLARASPGLGDIASSSLYYFPHCRGLTYPPDDPFRSPEPPGEEVVGGYEPEEVEGCALVRELKMHRLLVCCADSTPEAVAHYVRLLLRFQIKNQEYTSARRGSECLHRAYAQGLQGQLQARLRLVSEQTERRWLRHALHALPRLCSLLMTVSPEEAPQAKLALEAFRATERRVQGMRSVVLSGIPLHSLGQSELERVSKFLWEQYLALDAVREPGEEDGEEEPGELEHALDVVAGIVSACGNYRP